jgi:hypothetical protein
MILTIWQVLVEKNVGSGSDCQYLLFITRVSAWCDHTRKQSACNVLNKCRTHH